MTWSTQQLAALAGTTRRAVRHYHDVGLLAEPERTSSGLRQYDVSHLVRLIRIRRLAGLGMSLPQIADLDEDEFPAEALEQLRAELGTTIDSLRRTQRDLERVLERRSLMDQPEALTQVPPETSRADRALTVVISRVLTSQATDAWMDLIPSYVRSPAVRAFDDLSPTATLRARNDLSLAMSEHV